MKISNKMIILLLTGLLFAAALSAFFLWRSQPTGAQVVVTVNGDRYGSYDLYENQTVRIAPEDDSWYNLLTIQNGKAAITESDCSNQICVHTPALEENVLGIIVCLPHGVTVELKEAP